MNFIKTLNTVNFAFTIVALGNGQIQVTVKPTTDDAKVFCKAKKLSKSEPVTLESGDLISKIDSLENGVAALTAILQAA